MTATEGLLRGKTVAVDATTLEANAAMKSIVRRDTGDDWKAYLRKLMQEEEGIEDPSDEELRRFDKRRKNKKVSNAEWESPSDPDSRITKMKDGRTHLAYKAEHVVDLETEVILAAPVYHADQTDGDTLQDSLVQAQVNIHEVDQDAEIKKAAADKGYHKTATLANLAEHTPIRTYIPEPEHPYARRWIDKPEAQRSAVYNNRRRVKRAYGKKLQRLRSELAERSFAHICESGGARRTWLRGIEKVQKRYLVSAAVRNLGLIMRKLFGWGTAKALQAARDFFCASLLCYFLIQVATRLPKDSPARCAAKKAAADAKLAATRTSRVPAICGSKWVFSTGC